MRAKDLRFAELSTIVPNDGKRKELKINTIPLSMSAKQVRQSATASFLRSVLLWFRPSTINLGYYSPVDKGNNIQFNVKECNAMETNHCISINENDGNESSMKNVERSALEDELTTYMEEIRQREQRWQFEQN